MAKRRTSNQPYNKIEFLHFIKNHILGPSKKYRGLVDFIPHELVLNNISPIIEIGFIGDIMSST